MAKITPDTYLWPSLWSSLLVLFSTITLSTGYFSTFLNKKFVRDRGVIVFLQTFYFFLTSQILPDSPSQRERTCQVWGGILGYLFILNQVTFALLSYDIYAVFKEPFRSGKFGKYRLYYSNLIAFCLVFPILIDNTALDYREDLGLCWMRSKGGADTVNAYNWIIYFVPTFGQTFLSFCCFLYVVYHVQIWKPLTCQDWALSRYLGVHIWISGELLIYVVGYLLYYIFSGIAYLQVLKGLDYDQGGMFTSRSANIVFVVALTQHGTVEFILLLIINIFRMCVQRRVPGGALLTRFTTKRPKPKKLPPPALVLGDSNASYSLMTPESDDNTDQLIFEVAMQKKVLTSLEKFITQEEVQYEFAECVKIESCKAALFQEIRDDHNIVEFHSAFKGIASKIREGESGASGAIFSITNDRRFRLKSLDPIEAKTLIRIIDDLAQLWRDRRHSLICRVYALYGVTLMENTVYFMIMEDIFFEMGKTPPYKPAEVYDMKGSEYKRKVGTNPINGDVLKDLDFRLPLLLSYRVGTTLLNELELDSAFLFEKGLMDYSLLLGISYVIEREHDYEDPNLSESTRFLRNARPISTRKLSGYAFGIIDYLQLWNWRKRVERCFKIYLKCATPDKISAIPPNDYRERFLTNLRKRLFVHDDSRYGLLHKEYSVSEFERHASRSLSLAHPRLQTPKSTARELSYNISRGGSSEIAIDDTHTTPTFLDAPPSSQSQSVQSSSWIDFHTFNSPAEDLVLSV